MSLEGVAEVIEAMAALLTAFPALLVGVCTLRRRKRAEEAELDARVAAARAAEQASRAQLKEIEARAALISDTVELERLRLVRDTVAVKAELAQATGEVATLRRDAGDAGFKVDDDLLTQLTADVAEVKGLPGPMRTALLQERLAAYPGVAAPGSGAPAVWVVPPPPATKR